MSSSHKLLRSLRLLHLYIGVFTAPALLFFAFTGALQTFSLHETTRGSNYKPPAWAVTLAQLHKKQTTVAPRRVPPPDTQKPAHEAPSRDVANSDSATHHDEPTHEGSRQPTSPQPGTQPGSQPSQAPAAPKQHNTLPLKIFFLLVAIGLFISTLTGLYMSYRYIHKRALVTGILIAGIIVPIVLTAL